MKNGNPSERINFTKKSLEELKPNGKDTFYYDTKERGLYLMVRAKGTKSFGYRGRLYGMQKTFKICTFSISEFKKTIKAYLNLPYQMELRINVPRNNCCSFFPILLLKFGKYVYYIMPCNPFPHSKSVFEIFDHF